MVGIILNSSVLRGGSKGFQTISISAGVGCFKMHDCNTVLKYSGDPEPGIQQILNPTITHIQTL